MYQRDHLRQGEESNVTRSLIAGSVSGLLARFGTAPMDTIKIRLQITPGNASSGKALNVVKEMLHKEGIRGLWKGNVPGSLMYVVYGGVQFGTYTFYNRLLSPLAWNSQWHSFVVGALAGMSSSFVSYPFDVLRTRFVADRSRQLSTLRTTITRVFREDGPRGLFKGLTSSMVTITLATSILFSTYESIRIYCERPQRNALHRTLDTFASPIAGLISKLATFPLDTIRRRLVLSNSSDHKSFGNLYKSYHRRSAAQIGLQIIRQEGVTALYRGVTMALCKSVPSTAISLWSFERSMALLGG